MAKVVVEIETASEGGRFSHITSVKVDGQTVTHTVESINRLTCLAWIIPIDGDLIQLIQWDS